MTVSVLNKKRVCWAGKRKKAGTPESDEAWRAYLGQPTYRRQKRKENRRVESNWAKKKIK